MPILGGTGNASEYAYRSYLVDTPDPFDWPDVLNGLPATTYRSGYAKITGIKSPLRLSITPGYSYSLFANVFDNGQTVTFDNDNVDDASFDEYSDPSNRFTTGTGTVKNRQSIILTITTNQVPVFKKTSFDATRFRFNDYNPRFDSINEPENPFSGDFTTEYRPIVSVGKSTQDWLVRTKSIDQLPTSFSFINLTNQQTSSISTSNAIVITGLEPFYKFSATALTGISPGIIVDDKVSIATTEVYNGSIIKLQAQTPVDFLTQSDVSVQVGTFSTTWRIITEPENQNITFTPSDFVDQTNLQINTSYISNQITLTGISKNSTLPVSLSNTNTSYEVERGASIVKSFDASPIEVINNDKIRLRLTSSNSYNTTTSTLLTVGITTADWNITTISPPPPTAVTFTLFRSSTFDNQIIFTKQTGDGDSLLTFGIIPNDSTQTVNYSVNQNAVYLMTSATGTVRINSSNQIALNDSGGDTDFNDLIVTCSTGTFYSVGGSIYYNL